MYEHVIKITRFTHNYSYDYYVHWEKPEFSFKTNKKDIVSSRSLNYISFVIDIKGI